MFTNNKLSILLTQPINFVPSASCNNASHLKDHLSTMDQLECYLSTTSLCLYCKFCTEAQINVEVTLPHLVTHTRARTQAGVSSETQSTTIHSDCVSSNSDSLCLTVFTSSDASSASSVEYCGGNHCRKIIKRGKTL